MCQHSPCLLCHDRPLHCCNLDPSKWGGRTPGLLACQGLLLLLLQEGCLRTHMRLSCCTHPAGRMHTCHSSSTWAWTAAATAGAAVLQRQGSKRAACQALHKEVVGPTLL